MCLIKSFLVFDYKTNKTVGKAGKCLIYEWILQRVNLILFFVFFRRLKEWTFTILDCLEFDMQTSDVFDSEFIDLFINTANKSKVSNIAVFTWLRERTSFCIMILTQSICTVCRTCGILLIFRFLRLVAVVINTSAVIKRSDEEMDCGLVLGPLYFIVFKKKNTNRSCLLNTKAKGLFSALAMKLTSCSWRLVIVYSLASCMIRVFSWKSPL